MQPEKSLLHPLTALRFFAAILIVLHHSRGLFGERFVPTSLALTQGVSFFFVLSGFILAYNYPMLKSRENVLMFYAARFARIWPLHAIIALAILFFGSQTTPPTTSHVLLNVFLLQAWVPYIDVFFSLNAVSWSLSVELFFYAAFPLLIWRWKETWHWKLLIAAVMVVTMVSLANHYHLPYLAQVTNDNIGLDAVAYINPMTRLFEFTLGIATASIYRFASKIDMPWTRMQATVLELGVIVLAILTLRLCDSSNELYWIGPAGALYLSHQGGLFMWAVLIFVFAMERGWISTLLSTRIAVILGESSFALYMLHTVVLSCFTALKLSVEDHLLRWLCVYVLVCLVVAYLAFVLIEKPMRSLILSGVKRLVKK